MSGGIERLNALPEPELREALRACCSSGRWVDAMIASRPWESAEALAAAATAAEAALAEADWLEAFAGHPRIGERPARNGRSDRWSRGEQRGMEAAGEDVRARIAECNARYEERFGFVYLVRATGRSPEQLLDLVETRLGNSRDEELANAAAEHAQITRLRLEKLTREGDER